MLLTAPFKHCTKRSCLKGMRPNKPFGPASFFSVYSNQSLSSLRTGINFPSNSFQTKENVKSNSLSKSLKPFQPSRLSHHSAPSDTGADGPENGKPKRSARPPVTILDIKKMHKNKEPIAVC